MPLSLRFPSGTVAMDFVIPVAWGALLSDRNILTAAAKHKTTQSERCRLNPSDALELLAEVGESRKGGRYRIGET